MEELIRNLIKQIQDEEEPTNGSEWQSGYNNGLARVDELLCELYRTISGIELRQNQGCEYCNERNMPLWWNNAGHPTGIIIEPNFCPMCGKKLSI